jgi:hypothetical protein
MTELLEVAHKMGMTFEASRSGRWIRFHVAHGTAYVVEGAWGSYCGRGEG